MNIVNCNRYVFIVYNVLTLCKTLYFCRKECVDKDIDIIYIGKDNEFINRVSKDFNVYRVYINYKYYDSKIGKLKFVIKENIVALKTKKIIKKIISEYTDDNIGLVVFKDGTIRESTCIEYVKDNTKAKVILLEEGMGLYTMHMLGTRHIIRHIINVIMGVSTYALRGRPYGLHPGLDAVICKSPSLLRRKYDKYKRSSLIIIQEGDIFSKDNCKVYLDYLIGDKEFIKQSFKFVFLTTSWDDKCLGVENEYYIEFLNKLFVALSSLGKILLKRHPNDKYDYKRFVNANVFWIEELDFLPFEVVYEYFNKPIMIAINSSCCACDKSRRSYFLSSAFPNLPEVDYQYLKDNDIVDCSSISSLMENLKNDYFN